MPWKPLFLEKSCDIAMVLELMHHGERKKVVRQTYIDNEKIINNNSKQHETSAFSCGARVCSVDV